MTTARTIQELEERIANHPGPVLSVYLSVNLAYPENQKKGYAVRLKSALRERGVPKALAERVMELFQVERPHARTMVVFAAPNGLFEVYRLRVDLPEEVRWGEPYVAPLVLAFDEYEPYGVALLDAEKFRFLVAVLGEAEESLDAANPISTAHWGELTVAPSGTTLKSGVDKDAFNRRVEAHIHRFYKEMGETTRRLAFENGIGRLILAGPGERVAEFRRTLPNEVRDRVVAEAHIPTGASESEIVDRITAVQERVELERENRFIAEARERGVRGRSDTLEALQLGEVYHLLVPWPSEGEVRWCDNDALAVQDVQREHCPYCGEPTRIRPFVDVLVDLAVARAARIEFARGANAELLREEFGGLAGLTRF